MSQRNTRGLKPVGMLKRALFVCAGTGAGKTELVAMRWPAAGRLDYETMYARPHTRQVYHLYSQSQSLQRGYCEAVG